VDPCFGIIGIHAHNCPEGVPSILLSLMRSEEEMILILHSLPPFTSEWLDSAISTYLTNPKQST